MGAIEWMDGLQKPEAQKPLHLPRRRRPRRRQLVHDQGGRRHHPPYGIAKILDEQSGYPEDTRTYPDTPYEPKEAFHALARRYKALKRYRTRSAPDPGS